MSRTKTPQELAEAIAFFPPGASKMVQRLLKRAIDKEVRKIQRSSRRGGSRASAKQFSRSLGNSLASQLTRALKQRGAKKREAQSARQKAPDTGGRPFHFAHSTVNKDDTTSAAAGSSTKSTKSAAHMRYIEREIAVETTYGVDRTVPEKQKNQTDNSKGLDRENTLDQGLSSATAAQGYIENPVKLANGEQIIFSFGTIGDTFEERVKFWENLERNEYHPEARVQNRLIMELPHEAPPEARYEMVKGLCKKFEAKNIPFWAALHAPGKDNDSRNFHAHIVFSERPAIRMIDPADGEKKWDFSITVKKLKASRNILIQHPYRQNRDPELRKKNAIPALRREFAEIVNGVLGKNDVRDSDGTPVRYDARSYKDMGVDVAPMKSIDRIIADKMNEGKLTVLDNDYTKKMIRAEMKEAFARREKTTVEIVRLEQVLSAITANPKTAAAHNKKLPKGMQVSPLAKLGEKAVRSVAKKIVEAQHGALTQDLMERTTRTSLQRILEATNPDVIKASTAQTQNPARRAELPDATAASQLHEAAKEELAAFEFEARSARKAIRYRLGIALNEWKTLTGMPIENFSPIIKMAIDQQDRQAIQASRQKETSLRSRAPTSRETAPRAKQAETPDRNKARQATTNPTLPKADVLRQPAPPRQGGSRTEAVLAQIANLRFKGSPADFMKRMQAASNATEEYIKAIAAIPDLNTRLSVLDAITGRQPSRQDGERVANETLRETSVDRGKSGGIETSNAVSRDQNAELKSATPIATRSDKEISKPEPVKATAVGDQESQTNSAPETAKQKAARRRKERKAILAKQNRKGRGWER